MSGGCCREYRCERKKPYLIRRGTLSGRIYLITDYDVKSPGLIEAHRKHDITVELEAFMQAESSPTQAGPLARPGKEQGMGSYRNLLEAMFAELDQMERVRALLPSPEDSEQDKPSETPESREEET